MKLDQHYVEPRLVELYDIENPRGIDTDFYIKLAAELNANSMLAYARQQPGAEKVHWIEGDSASLEGRTADLVVMTGNVAQVFLEDAEWNTTLLAIHSALKGGGHLGFESRNPDAKAWEGWNRERTFQRINSPYGPIESWLEVLDVSEGKVAMRGYNHFLESEEEVVVDSTLRFRSQAELVHSLNNAGFIVKNVYGSWERKLVGRHSKVMIFIASRR